MKKFGIYIHWPYCLSKCPYCDFYSVPLKTDIIPAFEQAYRTDIARIPQSPSITSIFFGGGTPSLMPLPLVETILNALKNRFSFAPNIEITMEANPDAIDKTHMQALHALGVNRLSMGVQALNEADLTFLGRRHTAQTARTRIEEAKNIFDNLSIDLMYARPHQTVAAWEKELDIALAFDLPHYSLYQLTIEEGTPFYRRQIESIPEEEARRLFLVTWEKMEKAGIPLYEVSNFAKPGFECRHNLVYWQGDDYAGIGPAAHGRMGLTATENPKDIAAWLKGAHTTEVLTPVERREEKILMGLRLRTGLPLKGLSPKGIKTALHNRWITTNDTHVLPTQEGFLMLNPLIVLLTPDE